MILGTIWSFLSRSTPGYLGAKIGTLGTIWLFQKQWDGLCGKLPLLGQTPSCIHGSDRLHEGRTHSPAPPDMLLYQLMCEKQ
jgi:hypothetical protein